MNKLVGLMVAAGTSLCVAGCLGTEEDAARAEELALVGAVAVEPPREPSPWSILFEREAVIDAPLERVWNLLVDLDHYADWNPWIVWAEGDAVPGAVIRADVVMGDRIMEVEHVVLAVDDGRRFCWRDEGFTTLFVYGQRCRWIETGDDGLVHFRQQLLLEGIFAHVAKLMYGAALRDGMAAETAALEATAEQ